jgi:16S rRNA (adenine1518-N6/adenine1519-N6)-dimethyltransferase
MTRPSHGGSAAKKRLATLSSDPEIPDRIGAARRLRWGNDPLRSAGPGSAHRRAGKRGARIIAVEVDRDSCRCCANDLRNAVVIEADAADRSPAELLQAAGAAPPYAVVANLPYNVAALILRRLLEAPDPPGRLVVMVQLEVAQSIVSSPPHMTLLGVATQTYAEARIVMRVGRAAFRPQPQVDSAVVRLDVAPRPRVDVPLDVFFRVVRAGFGNPRKMLRNSLRLAGVKRERSTRVQAAAQSALRASVVVAGSGALTRHWLDRPDP